jgi:hypothetical protein
MRQRRSQSLAERTLDSSPLHLSNLSKCHVHELVMSLWKRNELLQMTEQATFILRVMFGSLLGQREILLRLGMLTNDGTVVLSYVNVFEFRENNKLTKTRSCAAPGFIPMVHKSFQASGKGGRPSS